MPCYVFLIEVWLAKISFQNFISIKRYREKTFGGVGSTPLPIRSGRANFRFLPSNPSQISKIDAMVTVLSLINPIRTGGGSFPTGSRFFANNVGSNKGQKLGDFS